MRSGRSEDMRALTFVIIALSLLAGEAKARIWTDATGKAKVDAEFLGMENGMVKLKFTRTGKVAVVPLEAFSEADQQYVEEQVPSVKNAELFLANLETRLRKANAAHPKDPQPHVLSGILLIQQDEFDEAIREFDKAIKLAPDSPYAFHARGLAWQKKGELAAAWKDFDRAISLAPHWAAAYRNRSENHYKLSWFRKSDPALEKMIDAARSRLEELRKREIPKHPWQSHDGFTWRNADRQHLLRRLATMDADRAYQLGVRDDALERACSLLEKGRMDEAVMLFSGAIRRDTVSSPSYRKRADAYLRLGELEKAITDLSMAVQINPRDASALRDLARAYHELDKTRDN
jgi:tetratricopeptide (TPR) repeat protein